MLAPRSVRLLAAILAGAVLTLALLLSRAPGPSPRPPQVPVVITNVRAQLALRPVLAAETALQQRPDDPEMRLRLAQASADSGDPVGAALALYPLKKTSPLSTQFAGYCIQVGWLDEAAETLRHLPAVLARTRLDLAAAYAAHGEAAQAAALLAPLEREALGPNEWLDGAITWYRCRQWGRAILWARRGAARQPENPAARGVLARCLLAAGRPEAALAALPASGADPRVEFWRGRAEARCPDAARRQSGRERLARLAAAEPDNAAVMFEAGRAFLASGEPRRALPLLSRAAVSRYEEILCYELLSRAYEALRRPAEAAWARGRSQAGRGQFKEACLSLRLSVDQEPTKPLAYVDLARALHAEGRVREAITVLERAQKVVAGSLDASLLKARLLLQLERVPDVIRELTAAAALDPKRANEPLGNLGTVYYDSQQYDRALPVLEQAVQIEDADAHSHYYLGQIDARRLEEPGRAEQAITHLLRAAQLQPDYSRPWMAAASVLQRMGCLAEAAACLRHAIAGECQADAPYVRLAQLLQLQGRLPERRLILQQYAATRNHDLKRTGLEKQTRDNPKDAERRYALGDLLLRESRPEQALPELLVAAGLRPGWKAAQIRLADDCALLGYDDLREEAERAAGRR